MTTPRGIMTELQRHLPREEMIAAGWTSEDRSVNERFTSPEQGAATSVWAVTSPELAERGGAYCEDCDIAELTVPGTPDARIRASSPMRSIGIRPRASGRFPRASRA